MTERVLCVDDEPRVLEGIESHLALDYDVSTATSGPAGLQLVRTQTFAVVISDMRMPEMNGAQFLAEVKTVSPDTTRVLLTGYSEVDAAIAAINEGSVFRFLTKPCPPDVLLTAVEEAIEQNRLRRAEKELLEGTVRGAVELLTDVLAIASPIAFARVNEVKRLATEAARSMGVSGGWELEVAALLARLGWIALPPEVLERHLAGEPLGADERRMIAETGETSARLLEHIPRLAPVAETIRAAHRPIGVVQADKNARIGAVLSAALAIDLEMTRGADIDEAISRTRLNEEFENAFWSIEPSREERQSWVIRKITADELQAGLILDEDVFMKNGNLIVRNGTELTAPMAARLQAFARNLGLQEPIRVKIPSSHDLAAAS